MTFNMGYDNILEGFGVEGKMQLGIIRKIRIWENIHTVSK